MPSNSDRSQNRSHSGVAISTADVGEAAKAIFVQVGIDSAYRKACLLRLSCWPCTQPFHTNPPLLIFRALPSMRAASTTSTPRLSRKRPSRRPSQASWAAPSTTCRCPRRAFLLHSRASAWSSGRRMGASS